MKTKIALGLFLLFLSVSGCILKSRSIAEGGNQAKTRSPEFIDVTNDMGLAGITGDRFSWGDFNNDGYPDLLIRDFGLYKNTGPASNWKFVDVTEKVELGKENSFGVWGDYNNDGFADILSCNGVLWKNNEGKNFKNVTEEVKLDITKKIATVSWGDYDNDGFIDIYIGPVGDETSPGQYTFYNHELWKNHKGKEFERISDNNKIGQTKTYGRSVIWCDYNNDGKQEIYVGNYVLEANNLWQFDSNDIVEDIARIVGCTGNMKTFNGTQNFYGHTIGASWADFNNDTLFDLWVTNLAHKQFSSGDIRGAICDDSYIYINQGKPNYKFIDFRIASGISRKPLGGNEDELWYDVVCADFDNDGYVDVFITQAYNYDYARTLFFHNLGNLKFKDVSTETKINLISNSGGVACSDFNCDGFIDIITCGMDSINGLKKVYLYRNIGNDKSWIKFQLMGSKSNRSAIGAIIKIKTEDGLQIRQIEGSAISHGQQNSMMVHFGLNNIKMAKEAEIIWPSGEKQILKNLLARKIYKIEESLLKYY